MRNKSHSKRIENAQIMLSGITDNKENLANRGINDQYIEEFKTLAETCVNQNSRQEKIKAELKDLTQELKDNMDKLDAEVQFCKRCVKINMPKTLWKAFGFIYRYRKAKPKNSPVNPPDDTTDDNTTEHTAPQNVEVKKGNENGKKETKEKPVTETAPVNDQKATENTESKEITETTG